MRDNLRLEAHAPWMAGVVVGLVALIVYALTLSPTVNFIDSGEFIAVGRLAGIAHPPGYPLYTLLTIAGAALPFGDSAVGVNFISALSGAVAVGFFYALVYELISQHLTVPRNAEVSVKRNTVSASTLEHEIKGPEQPAVDWLVIGASAGAALLLCGSFTVWNWSTQAKLYSLQFAFTATLFWLALRVRRSVRGAGEPRGLWPPRRPGVWSEPVRWLVFLAFGVGLALTNHTLSFTLLPSLAVIALWPEARTRGGVPPAPTPKGGGRKVQQKGQQAGARSHRARTVLDAPVWRWLLVSIPLVVIAALLPLVIYLYLPLRSAQNPVLNWGSPSTWGDFWRHVTLWQNRVLVGRETPGGMAAYITRSLDLAIGQFGPWLGLPVLLLAVVGGVRLARNALPILIAMLLLVVITVIETYNFQLAEVAAYFEQLYMMFIAWAGVGIWYLGGRIVNSRSAQEPGYEQNRRSRIALAVIPLGLAALALVWNAGRAGHANDHLAEAYVHNEFSAFAPRAVVLTNNWYLVSPSFYLQLVRGEHADVAVIDRKLLQYPFYLDYVTRQYPEVMASVKDLAGPFGEISRRWVDGEAI
ncbi:MAG: DUF2723 domain-containing protein, partial [Chloroflexia bacterium]